MEYSETGAVKLNVHELHPLQLMHLFSELDQCTQRCPADCGCIAALQGYTEWISTTQPALSLGWDWAYVMYAGKAEMRRDGPPRTNIQLINAQGVVIAWPLNLAILSDYVDQLSWQSSTQQHMHAQYA